MSTAAFTAKSTQIVAATAVVIALLGGAYAVGRSQGPTADVPVADAAPVTEAAPRAADRAEPAPRTAPRPAKVAAPTPAPVPAVDREQQALARLCDGCGLVTDVHTESRKGEGSGVGAVGGAVVGGLLGNMVGGGNGKKLATVAGAVGGGYAGNEIEKQQKTRTIWVVQVKESDGRLRRFERSADPGLRVGDEVQLTENGFSRR